MYNPYLPRFPGAAPSPPRQDQEQQDKKRRLSGLWKSLRLDELDTGDVLLLLILLLLWSDDSGDHTELIFMLGLMLFL